MPLNKEILKQNLNRNFVETGTWLGEGIQAALDAGFEWVWSVDIDPVKTAKAQLGFKHVPTVTCATGDSALFLQDLKVNFPTTFWLDAHPGGYFNLLQPDLPLVNELLALSWYSHHQNNIILIDDIRLFSETDNKRMRDYIQKLWPSCEMDYIDSTILPNDILRIRNLS